MSNRILLAGALTLFGALFWYGLTGEALSIGNDLLWLYKAAPWALGVVVSSLLVQSLIPRPVKELLVFHRWDGRLPSYGAFNARMLADSRIDVLSLTKIYRELPDAHLEQHRLWYRLYRKHNGKPAVVEALSRYLLFRDLCAFSVGYILVSMFILQLAIPGNWPGRVYLMLVIAAVCYLLFLLAARQSARDLCQNVLAIESSSGSSSVEQDADRSSDP